MTPSEAARSTAGGVTSTPSTHDEHVRTRALAELAARCWRRWLRRRRVRGRARAPRTFSAYEVVLSPAIAPRSLRAPRHDDHAGGRRRRPRRRLAATITVGAVRRPLGAERCRRPPVTVIRRRRARRGRWRASTASAAARSSASVGRPAARARAPSARGDRGGAASANGATVVRRFIVSNTPSPTMSPWSNGETRGAGRRRRARR